MVVCIVYNIVSILCMYVCMYVGMGFGLCTHMNSYTVCAL